jgi:DNA-binding transcriptional ArsR family regulator
VIRTQAPFATFLYFDYYRIMQETDVVTSLAALAQPMRLRVFRELVVAGAGGLTPGALSEHLEVPGATLSFHLKELLRAGLVSQERASRNLIYRADFTQMNALLGFLTQNCCQGESCETGAARCKPARAKPVSPSSTPRRATHEALPRPRSRQ